LKGFCRVVDSGKFKRAEKGQSEIRVLNWRCFEFYVRKLMRPNGSPRDAKAGSGLVWKVFPPDTVKAAQIH